MGISPSYLRAWLRLLPFKRLRLRLKIDRQDAEYGMFTIIGVSNGRYFGGGMHIAPMADLEDGYVEVLYVKDTNIFKFIHHVLLRVHSARHLGYRNVYHRRAKEITITGDKVCPIDVDGEEERCHEVTISVLPRALKIRVP